MEKSREQIIVRTSVIGIAANVLLAAFKAAVGLVSNSVAVILDAVNNLSDAVISASTLVAAIIFLATGVSLEAWLGAVISIVIIKSGFDTVL